MLHFCWLLHPIFHFYRILHLLSPIPNDFCSFYPRLHILVGSASSELQSELESSFSVLNFYWQMYPLSSILIGSSSSEPIPIGSCILWTPSLLALASFSIPNYSYSSEFLLASPFCILWILYGVCIFWIPFLLAASSTTCSISIGCCILWAQFLLTPVATVLHSYWLLLPLSFILICSLIVTNS